MSRQWWMAGAVGTLVLLTYVWLPGTAQAAMYDVVSAGAAAAALVATVRSGGRVRLVWGLLTAAQASYAVADAWYNAVALTAGEVPIPHGTDVFYLAYYPLAGLALLLLSPVRAGTGRADAFIDALLAGSAARAKARYAASHSRSTGVPLTKPPVRAVLTAKTRSAKIVSTRLRTSSTSDGERLAGPSTSRAASTSRMSPPAG